MTAKPDIVAQLLSLSYGPGDIPERGATEIVALKAEIARKDRMLVIAGRVISGKISIAEADAEARAALTTQEKANG